MVPSIGSRQGLVFVFKELILNLELNYTMPASRTMPRIPSQKVGGKSHVSMTY